MNLVHSHLLYLYLRKRLYNINFLSGRGRGGNLTVTVTAMISELSSAFSWISKRIKREKKHVLLPTQTTYQSAGYLTQ
jgi:hypothetical protein